MKLVIDERTAGRILVALDASRHGFAALEVAAVLAAQLRAELHGLFIEDASLLKLAALPNSQEVCFSIGVPRPLDAAALKRRLRAKAEEARRLLEESASRAEVVHSFRVSQGGLVRETLSDREAADVFVVGHQSRAADVVGPSSKPPGYVEPIAAYCPNTVGGRRTLALAARVARADALPVMLLFPDAETAEDEKVAEQCRLWLEGQKIRVVTHDLAAASCSDLLRAARRSSSRLMLLALDSELLDEGAIERLVCEIGVPVVLVR